MGLFDIQNIAVEIWGYPISYVELLGTLFGLVSVYFASRAHILTWPTGIANEVFLFLLFFQVQLYADMFLQVYFLVVTLYGWYQWRRQASQIQITRHGQTMRWLLLIIIALGTTATGLLIRNIHLYLPGYFKIPAAYPFVDSFVMVCSIVATVLLAQKKIETWILWLVVDVVSVILYFKKGVYFLSLEYLVFLGLATYGMYNWRRTLRHG